MIIAQAPKVEALPKGFPVIASMASPMLAPSPGAVDVSIPSYFHPVDLDTESATVSMGLSTFSSALFRFSLYLSSVPFANTSFKMLGDSTPMPKLLAPSCHATGKKGMLAGQLAAAQNRKLPSPPCVLSATADITRAD